MTINADQLPTIYDGKIATYRVEMPNGNDVFLNYDCRTRAWSGVKIEYTDENLDEHGIAKLDHASSRALAAAHKLMIPRS